jgi:hypothetical protein
MEKFFEIDSQFVEVVDQGPVNFKNTDFNFGDQNLFKRTSGR